MIDHDAVVVGAGPNGLAAAIELARSGCRVLVVEGEAVPGGGARSAALTEPGFVHDSCSAVHPLALASPFFRSLDLGAHGLTWIHPPAAVAHPLPGEPAVLLEGTVEETATTLGVDAEAYRRMFASLARAWEDVVQLALGPVLRIPARPLLAARFGRLALRSASGLAARFRRGRTRALLAGSAGHSVLPLDRAGSGGVAVVLGLAGHGGGWPIPEGGAGSITAALVACLRSVGGELETDRPVRSLADLPASRVVLLDVGPHQAAIIAGERLPAAYRNRLLRYRYGPGVFKLDWALHGPIPWTDPACARAATVHVGGSFEEIAASESAVWQGRISPTPFLILTQPSLFDATRAPPGKHTAWAYCHVPNGFSGDLTQVVEAQVERFAPGFRDQILARHAMGPADLQAMNPNLVGGDVAGGAMDLRQLLFRPTVGLRPYAMPVRGLYLCSASTPPGGGVHGMCGYHAARAALRVACPPNRQP